MVGASPCHAYDRLDPLPHLFVPIPALRRLTFALLLVSGLAGDVAAQSLDLQRSQPSAAWQAAPDVPAFDAKGLRAVYHVEASAFRGAMQGADWSAYPVFVGAPFVAWGGTWLLQDHRNWSVPYRLTVSQVATYGAVIGLKALFRRPRPYVTLSDIQSRSARYSPTGSGGASFSLPSGHAAMAFAVAASLSLSYPEWYVIGPGAAWASSVALSRVWLGVHYPSDIVAGALLGTALSVVVHLVGPSITPEVLAPEDEAMRGPAMQLQFRF
jgi:membrane-associated phospholipid phosphatase